MKCERAIYIKNVNILIWLANLETDLHRPEVGLNPQIPQKDAGIRTLPPISVPIPRMDPPPATSAPSPPEDPPEVF